MLPPIQERYLLSGDEQTDTDLTLTLAGEFYPTFVNKS
jgi:hypothetical protein